MKTIVCTGDSHTWGQGADGLFSSISPPAEAGELRLAGFSYPCYVNLLRDWFNARTGSRAGELSAGELAEQLGLSLSPPFALLEPGTAALRLPGRLVRLQFRCTPESPVVEAEGFPPLTLSDRREDDSLRPIRNLLLRFPDDGVHTIRLTVSGGSTGLFRGEWYAGEGAVVNSGVGSTTTLAYRKHFWKEYLEDLRPAAVILEAHSINDWLNGVPPETSRRQLAEMLRRARELEALAVLLTVSPAAGPQTVDNGLCTRPYAEYAAASRMAAADAGAVLCDANALMQAALAGLTAEEARRYLFDDPWHVNHRGHRIYAAALENILEAAGGIPEPADSTNWRK